MSVFSGPIATTNLYVDVKVRIHRRYYDYFGVHGNLTIFNRSHDD